MATTVQELLISSCEMSSEDEGPEPTRFQEISEVHVTDIGDRSMHLDLQ